MWDSFLLWNFDCLNISECVLQPRILHIYVASGGGDKIHLPRESIKMAKNVLHYFFECAAYTAHRQELMDHLRGLLPGHGTLLGWLETKSNRAKLTKIITNGIKSDNKDIELFKTI